MRLSSSATKSDLRGLHSETIAGRIEADIAAGELPAGAKLDETALAARFGVSRTPVREALQLLVANAMAERVPYKGVVVARLSIERIDEIFEAMGEIEALCGRLAAGKMSMAERVTLERLHSAMEVMAEAGDVEAYEQANSAFHGLIYAGCHNRELAEVAETLRRRLAPFRRSQLLNAERLLTSSSEHAEIVGAIIERDGLAAERHLRRHLLSSAHSYVEAHRQRLDASRRDGG